MPLHAKKEWVQQLDASKTAWDIERSQICTSQTVLTIFLHPNLTSQGRSWFHDPPPPLNPGAEVIFDLGALSAILVDLVATPVDP